MYCKNRLEFALLQSLHQHSNIISSLDVISTDDAIWTIMEYSVRRYQLLDETGALTKLDPCFKTDMEARPFRFCNIAHLHISLENVLLDVKKTRALVCDFGLSQLVTRVYIHFPR